MFNYLKKLAHNLKNVWNSPGNRENRFHAILRAFSWFIAKRFLNQPVKIKVYGDRIFHCYPKGFISNTVMLFGEYECYDSLHFIEKWLRPEDRYLDIGANVGLFTLLASRHVEDKNITCIEPGKVQLSHLKENLECNKIHANILPYCISDKSGTMYLSQGDAVAHILEPSLKDVHNSEEVVAVCLDDILPHHVYHLMKLDVEGFELKSSERSFKINFRKETSRYSFRIEWKLR